ncbi:hypothetical protein S83_017323, partial [Arachis hypogaea]
HLGNVISFERHACNDQHKAYAIEVNPKEGEDRQMAMTKVVRTPSMLPIFFFIVNHALYLESITHGQACYHQTTGCAQGSQHTTLKALMSHNKLVDESDPSESSGTKTAPIIIQSKNSSFNAGIVLDETNYDVWCQMMEMHIAEKEKLSFIHGKTAPPTEKDTSYDKWYTDNQRVKRWLLMSTSPEIMKRYICLPTAREIWKALSKAFYDGADELQVFTLNQRAFSAKQDGRTLSIYYGELNEIFGKLDHHNKGSKECEKDVELYRKSIERQRVHIFLAGLDCEFDQIR